MEYLNLMKDQLKPKEVSETLENVINALENITRPTAEMTSYNNTTSGLSANNVQSAIDEIKGKIDNLPSTVTVLATSSGTKTNAQHIAVLKSVWDTLTEDQKMKCKVRRAYQVYNPTSIANTSGRFSSVEIGSQVLYVEMIRMSDTSLTILNGNNYQDISNSSIDTTYILYL